MKAADLNPFRLLHRTSVKDRSALDKPRTRRTVRIRLFLVVVLLASILGWGVYASNKASGAPTNETNTITPEIYKVPHDVLVQIQAVPGNCDFVRSHGNLSYYEIVKRGSWSWQDVVLGYVFVTTDLAPDWSYGYLGPISVLASMDTKGVVLAVKVVHWLDNRPGETLDAPWLSTLVGKSVLGDYKVGTDIDGVSGATITSAGIVNGIREGGRAVLQDAEHLAVSQPLPAQLVAKISDFTTHTDYLQSFVLLSLIGVTIVGMMKKIELIRYGVLLSSLLLMEYAGTRMISIEDFLNLRNLTLPPLHGNLYWYLLFGSAFFLSFIWGRVYCGWLCPFGAMTELLNKLLSKLLPFKFRMPTTLEGKASAAKYLVLAIVVGTGLITGDLALKGIEPFYTFFFADGTRWMWLWLFVVLGASVVVNRGFCRYVCPTGAVLALAARLRGREISRWPDCATCCICERDCSVGAIRGARISAMNCLNCGTCERNYQDAQSCPHWLRLSNYGPTG